MAKQSKRLTRDEVVARFEEKQAENRAARGTKVTAEDVAAKLAARKAERAASGRAGERARTVSVALGVVLILGAGALAVSTAANTTSFQAKQAAGEEAIASAQSYLDALPASDQDSAGVYAAELEAQLDTARVKAEEVAALQQQFSEILVAGNTEDTSNGGASPAFLASVEHRKLLAPYFVDRAMIADDTLAYAPGSALPFDADQIDPRYPWFVAHEKGKPGVVAPAGSNEWTLRSVTPSTTPGVHDVTWLDTDTATGDLLAWATASYYAGSETFGALSVGRTTQGEQTTTTIETAGQ